MIRLNIGKLDLRSKYMNFLLHKMFKVYDLLKKFL